MLAKGKRWSYEYVSTMDQGGIGLELDEYTHGFTTQNRVMRGLWKVVQVTLFSLSPSFAHSWRRTLLRLFGAKIHPTAHVYPSVRIWAPWNLEMGRRSCLSWGVDCYCVDRISLGENALVSQYARLIAASHAIDSPNFHLVRRPIVLESESWVCAYAYIGMGVTVGRGAVVAATATVVKSVEPWAIVGGNPAQPIGMRRTCEGPTTRGENSGQGGGSCE